MNERKKTSVGGQALIEGIMMKGPSVSSMAVRKANGELHVETWDNKPTRWYHKFPVVRGVTNFFSSLVTGYTCLMKSAEISGMLDDEDAPEEKKSAGGAATGIITTLAAFLAVCVSLGLFILLPSVLVDLFDKWVLPMGPLRGLAEAVLKMVIFVVYLWACTFMKDIRRMFSYHGAEHKSIACYEAGEELTVENIRRHRRFHPRCGTSFMLIAIIVSALVFSAVTVTNIWLRTLLKVLLMPLVVGLSYEVIKWAGRHENALSRALSAPGMWMQHLTTFEPDESMIETAVAALLPTLPKEGEDDRW